MSEENALSHLFTGLLLRPDNYGWACECVGVTSGSVTRDSVSSHVAYTHPWGARHREGETERLRQRDRDRGIETEG